MNKIAVEFVLDVLRQNPGATNFGDIYDAMSRAACNRSFRNLGYHELARTGVSFSLLDTSKLEDLITKAQESIPAKDEPRQIN